MKLKIENFNHLGILQEILEKRIKELEKNILGESIFDNQDRIEIHINVLDTISAGWVTDEFPDVVEIEFGEEEEEVIEELLEEDARLKLPRAIWPPVPGNSPMRKDLCEIADAKADDGEKDWNERDSNWDES